MLPNTYPSILKLYLFTWITFDFIKFPLPSRPDNLIEIYEVVNAFDVEFDVQTV